MRAAERTSGRAFLGVSGVVFVASAAVTVAWCGSMSAMGGMLMPGGWTMSMTWMRMPGQTWPGAAASFLARWGVMMVAMMLPSLVPMLWRYREAVGVAGGAGVGGAGGARVGQAGGTRVGRERGGARLGLLTAVVGAGYFFVWAALGSAAYPLGVALSAAAMREPALSRAVPVAAGVVVLVAGLLQLTAWKARQLACCREAPRCGCTTLPAHADAAWRHGLRLGVKCARCCGGLMAILLVLGIMDLRAMALVTAAITAERLAPAGHVVARALGAVVVGVGLLLIARAVGL